MVCAHGLGSTGIKVVVAHAHHTLLHKMSVQIAQLLQEGAQQGFIPLLHTLAQAMGMGPLRTRGMGGSNQGRASPLSLAPPPHPPPQRSDAPKGASWPWCHLMKPSAIQSTFKVSMHPF